MTSPELKQSIRSQTIKELAIAHSFDDCRIAKAGRLELEERRLENWLNKNYHGDMAYLANHFDKRVDPTKLVPGAKSVIVLTKNYYPKEFQRKDAPQISKYAYGRDYHKVIRKKLKQFLESINEQFGEVHGRGFVDSAPVLEKAWAQKSGIGWMGKHSNIITKKRGSFYFLAVLVVDLELSPDDPVIDHCGTCTKCIDACPTNAIVSPYEVEGKKCISYATIELKSAEIPSSFKDKMDNWMFGCDICQDVCPWNRFSEPHQEAAFEAKENLLSMDTVEWKNLKEEKFEHLFSGSAVRRTKYQGLMRNIRFLPISH